MATNRKGFEVGDMVSINVSGEFKGIHKVIRTDTYGCFYDLMAQEAYCHNDWLTKVGGNSYTYEEALEYIRTHWPTEFIVNTDEVDDECGVHGNWEIVLWFWLDDILLSTYKEDIGENNEQYKYDFDVEWCGLWETYYKWTFILKEKEESKTKSPFYFNVGDKVLIGKDDDYAPEGVMATLKGYIWGWRWECSGCDGFDYNIKENYITKVGEGVAEQRQNIILSEVQEPKYKEVGCVISPEKETTTTTTFETLKRKLDNIIITKH